jgi:hypothetical protein
MHTFFSRRLVFIAALTFLAACSSTPAEKHAPTERVNRIVDAVREATSKGFLDVTIDYVKPNLYISGHTYSTAHIARLMRSAYIDRLSNLQLVEAHPEVFRGRHTSAFKLVESDVGEIHNWSGPIAISYSPASNDAEITGDMLHLYSCSEYEFVGAVRIGEQRKAIIRTKDGVIYSLRVGDTLGSELAVVNEINDSSVVLFEQTGARHELRARLAH